MLFYAGLALVTWVAWATLVHQIGTRIWPERETKSDMGELLRTIGFAAGPGALQAFAVLPQVSRGVFVFAWIWMLAAMVVAVRQALDFHSTWRAILVCATAAALSALVAFTAGVLFGPVVA